MTLNSGPHGCSVIAAPPVTSRASSTIGRRPAFGEEARRNETVVSAADDDGIRSLSREVSHRESVVLTDRSVSAPARRRAAHDP